MLMQSSCSSLSLFLFFPTMFATYLDDSFAWHIVASVVVGSTECMFRHLNEFCILWQGESLYALVYLVIGTLFIKLSRQRLVEKGEKVEYAFDFCCSGCSLWHAC